MRIIRTAVLSVLCVASAAAQGTQPLEVSLGRGVDEPLLRLNQAAYVAVFEVLPGLGVQQLYPRSGFQATQMMQPGEYLLPRPMNNYALEAWSASRPYATPLYVVRNDGRVQSYYYATQWSNGVRPGRTLLAVASRAPLRRVEAPQAANRWLQQVVGFRAIANQISTSEEMLNDIVAAITPLSVGPDDVVVDVLEINHQNVASVNRLAGQSISFSCDDGMYSMPAQFFFDTGIFRCPPMHPNVNPWALPTRPKPTDTTSAPSQTPIATPPETDALKIPGRKLPTPSDGRSADGADASSGIDRFHRATVSYGTVMPITYTGSVPSRGGVNPATGAWVPPTPSATPSDYGYGAGRFTPAGSSNGSGSTGSYNAVSPSVNTATSSAVPVSAAASVPGNQVAPGSAGDRHANQPKDPR